LYSRPDNVVVVGGSPEVVIDAKYKRLSDAVDAHLRRPNNSDVYELVAAMTAHGCHRGLLIYPRILGDVELLDGELRTWNVDAFGTSLVVGAVGLDLARLRGRADLQALHGRLASLLREAVPVLRSRPSVA
jgi:hypothetical protein